MVSPIESLTWTAEQHAANFRRSPVRRALFRKLQRDLWHVTSEVGYGRIKEAGAILPNVNDQFLSFYKADSFAKAKDYVALFDFETPTREQIIPEWVKCERFFTLYKPTIALRLDRRQLFDKLIANDAARGSEGRGKQWIPVVEVWYPEPIPVSAIVERAVINHDGSELRVEVLR